MRRLFLRLALFCIAAAQQPASAQDLRPEAVVAKLRAAIVGIAVMPPAPRPESKDSFFRPISPGKREPTQISGLLISPDGFILTSAGAFSEVGSIRVVLDSGEVTTGTLVGQDEAASLALVKIAGTARPYVRVAPSLAVAPGERVLAMGREPRPGFEFLVSEGIVNKIVELTPGKPWLIHSTPDLFDAMGGGPLVRASNGDVLGVITHYQVSPRSTLRRTVATPVSTFLRIEPALRAGGQIERAMIGIVPGQALAGLEDGGGVPVESVLEDGPAHAAGIREGDVIPQIDGNAVTSAEQLIELIGNRQPGGRLAVKFSRDGREKVLQIVTEKRRAKL